MIGQLHWFLQKRRCDSCAAFELRQFLVCLREAHTPPGGRWDDPHLKTLLRPSS